MNVFYISCNDTNNVEFHIRKFWFLQLKSVELFQSSNLNCLFIFKSVERTFNFVSFGHAKQHFG